MLVQPVETRRNPFRSVQTSLNLSKHVTTCRNTLQSVQTCWNTFPADDVFSIFYCLFFYFIPQKNQIHTSPLLPLFPLPPQFPPFSFFWGGGGGEGNGKGKGQGTATATGSHHHRRPVAPPKGGGQSRPPFSIRILQIKHYDICTLENNIL